MISSRIEAKAEHKKLIDVVVLKRITKILFIYDAERGLMMNATTKLISGVVLLLLVFIVGCVPLKMYKGDKLPDDQLSILKIETEGSQLIEVQTVDGKNLPNTDNWSDGNRANGIALLPGDHGLCVKIGESGGMSNIISYSPRICLDISLQADNTYSLRTDYHHKLIKSFTSITPEPPKTAKIWVEENKTGKVIAERTINIIGGIQLGK